MYGALDFLLISSINLSTISVLFAIVFFISLLYFPAMPTHKIPLFLNMQKAHASIS